MADTTIAADLRQIGQIALNAHDVDRAVVFYRDVLGLPLLFRAPPNLAFFDCGGVRLMLSPPEGVEFDHPGSILYYKVGDVHAAAQRITSRGVPLISEPHLVAKLPDHDLWTAFLKDTEGNTLALMSEVRGS